MPFESLLLFSVCLNCLLLCEVTPFWDLKPTLLNPYPETEWRSSFSLLSRHIKYTFILATEQLHSQFSLSCIGEGNGNPLQCSCLENPRDGGAWWASVYGVTQSRTRLKWLSSSSSAYYRLQGVSFYSTRQWLLGCSLSSECAVWSMLGITAVNEWPDPTCNNHLWPCHFVTLKFWSARVKWEYHDLTLPSPLDWHFPLIFPTLSKNPFPSQGSFCFSPSPWLWLEGKQCGSFYMLKPQPVLGNTGSVGHQMSAGAGGCLKAVALVSVPEGCTLLFIVSLRVLQNALRMTSLAKLLSSSWKQPKIHQAQNSGIANSKYLQ